MRIGRVSPILALVAIAAGYFSVQLAPLPPALFQAPAQSVTLLDRHGVPLRERPANEQFRRELTLADVPPHVVSAVMAAEDKRFFRHGGVDWLATGRALSNGLLRGRITSGASTITQQLIKISQRRPRTWRTKFIEAAAALRLERSWTKDQILAAYLNRVEFGNLNVGLAAAADFYFAKPVSDLSVAEAALLAGLPRNPRRLNPHLAREPAIARQQLILQRMHENGWLDAKGLALAQTEPVHLAQPRRAFRAPHFADLLLQETTEFAGPAVRTTLDLALNDRVADLLRERLARLREHNVRDAAAVVIENATGDVLALVGSADYFAPGTGQVNGAWAKRSAGSTLKPFTYLLALEQGATPATLLADVRTSFPTGDGFYRPENYNRRCYGPVSLRTALGSSLNIPAVKTLQNAGGPAALQKRLLEVGLTTLTHPPEVYGLGLTLGNCEARLLELTNAYASLARLGSYRPYRLRTDAPTFERAYSRPELAWQIADILSDNSARTLSFGINSALRYDYPVACKTGTSTDFRDNWTIGFTPEYSVGVWVGNFDGAPMKEVSGVTGAGPILHDIFDHLRATRVTSWYARPPQIVERTVHPLTGKVLATGDQRGVMEKLVATTLPAEESTDDCDERGRVRLSPEYAEWLASAENSLAEKAVLATDGSPLRIVSPLSGSVYLVDPDVHSSRRIPLVATGGRTLEWASDSLECIEEDGRTLALAAEGSHRIDVVDTATGRRAEVQITIRSL